MTTIYDVVTELLDLGYNTIPGFQMEDGGIAPLSYKDGEFYPADAIVKAKKTGKEYNPWDRASFIGLRLDRCLLVDYDGNKGQPELTLRELAEALGGVDLRAALVQYGLNPDGPKNGSYHFLFKFDRVLDRDMFYQSQDGHFRGIDFKTGNQLIWLKPGKARRFPVIGELPKATAQMIAILRKPPEEVRGLAGPVRIKQAHESKERGLMWLERACDNLATMGEGGRNKALNSTALAAFRHALANEFDMSHAEASLREAAQACGLKSSEIRDTLKSARSKANRAGPCNLPDRPRENYSNYSRMRG